MPNCNVKVCKICFAMDCQLHLLHEDMELYKAYEAVTALVLADEEDLPPYLCSSCADQLMSCARFRHRSLQAHLMLLDILKNHDHITVESIQHALEATHCDNKHIEDEILVNNIKMEIQDEDIPEDPIATDLSDNIKTDNISDDGANDRLSGDEAAPPCGVEANDIVKEKVFLTVSVEDNEDNGTMGTGSRAVCNKVEMFSDSDESDLEMLEQLSDWDDEDESEPARARTFVRVNYMESLDEADFVYRFRITKPAFEALLKKIMPFVRVTSARNFGVSPLHQLLLTLRFYALGTMLISVAEFVGVSVSTAGRIVHDISNAIASLYGEYVVMQRQSAELFYQIAGFPRVLGVIDCTHVRIQSPSLVLGEEFRNRNGYFSLNVQGVCDANLKFINMVARWPGSTHDATIFHNSNLRAECEAGKYENRWLLGDNAYPNRPYLLTPVLNPNTTAQSRYNDAHIKTRNTIERTFSVWKRRFPILALTLRLCLPKAQAVIIATSVLHNLCRELNLEEVPPEVAIPEADVISHDVTASGLEDNAAQRELLINNYFA